MRRKSPLAARQVLSSIIAVPLAALLGYATLAAAQSSSTTGPAPGAVPVAVTIAAKQDYRPPAAFSGAIAARQLSSMSFRINGLITRRLAEVGDHVDKGAVLAEIDSAQQQAGLRVAQAGRDAAMAQLVEARAAFSRQKRLLEQGFTRRSAYDEANQQLQTSQNMLNSANAGLESARQQLSYTQLIAPQSGIITARTVETGQVVQAAQAAFVLAMDGPRDAIFDVQETLIQKTDVGMAVTVSLLSDPTVTTQGHVREIAPVIDAQAQTVRIKVEIADKTPQMTLGSAITGTLATPGTEVVMLPWSAMTSDGGQPAVWKVDPDRSEAVLTPIRVLAYEKERFAVTQGVAAGDRIVSAGAQLLRPAARVFITATDQEAVSAQ